MDSNYCAPLRFNGALALEIVDDEWAKDKLPIEDVQSAPVIAALLAADPSDDPKQIPEKIRWADLDLQDLDRA